MELKQKEEKCINEIIDIDTHLKHLEEQHNLYKEKLKHINKNVFKKY